MRTEESIWKKASGLGGGLAIFYDIGRCNTVRRDNYDMIRIRILPDVTHTTVTTMAQGRSTS